MVAMLRRRPSAGGWARARLPQGLISVLRRAGKISERPTGGPQSSGRRLAVEPPEMAPDARAAVALPERLARYERRKRAQPEPNAARRDRCGAEAQRW